MVLMRADNRYITKGRPQFQNIQRARWWSFSLFFQISIIEMYLEVILSYIHRITRKILHKMLKRVFWNFRCHLKVEIFRANKVVGPLK